MAALLENVSANGSGTATVWPGGKGTFFGHATAFDSATITFEARSPADSAVWIAVSSITTLTANGLGFFELPAGEIRATVSGGGGSLAGVYAYAVQH